MILSNCPLGDKPKAPNSKDQEESPSQREPLIQRALANLTHACKCKKEDCSLESCKRMKKCILHIKTCQKRQSGECPLCKQMIALAWHHAAHCQDATCVVIFCKDIKNKKREQKEQEKMKQIQADQRKARLRERISRYLDQI